MQPVADDGNTSLSVQADFLAQLGRAMNAAGAPVGLTTNTLRRIAANHGASDAEVLVLPTMVLVRLPPLGDPSLGLTSNVSLGLRLEQVGAVFALANRAVQSVVEPSEGLAQVAEIWTKRARFSPPVRALGHAVLAVGLGLIVTPRLEALAWCAGLGLVVGALKLVGNYSRVLSTLMPVGAASIVGMIVFAAASAGQIVAPLLLLLPPLITFLPGGLLTTGMLELTDGHIVSGASRLVAWAIQVCSWSRVWRWRRNSRD